MIPLPAGEVHVFYLLADEVADPVLLSAYERLLTPAEHDRRERYLVEPPRREYLLTRVLARTTLSRYAPLAPEAWRFTANEHGRPAIANELAAPLHFNLSNTRGLIACAVAPVREVGIDVEDTERSGNTVNVADHFFSPAEVRALRAVPEHLQHSRFFDYWTLKEAYIKARGMGLAIPLDQFSFTLEPRPIRVSFDPRLRDDAGTWQFEQLALSPRHRCSAAIRRGPEGDARFVLRKVVPLVD